MTRAERQKEWENRITQYRDSGESVKEWCAANNVKADRLWYWLRKYKTGRAYQFKKEDLEDIREFRNAEGEAAQDFEEFMTEIEGRFNRVRIKNACKMKGNVS